MTVPPRVRPTGILLLDKILEGSAPPTARAAAARGALPVPRDVLLTVLVHLTEDPEPVIVQLARGTIAAYTPEELTPVLGNRDTDPRVLAFFAGSAELKGEPLAALIANESLTDDVVLSIASTGSVAAIDMLLLNQERLARTPAAVDTLLANTGLSGDQRRRLLDFAEHIAPAEGAKPEEPEEPLAAGLLGPVSEQELQSLLGQLGDLPFIDLEVGEFLSEEHLIDAEAAEAVPGDGSDTLYLQILRMSPAQRLRAAMRGGREVRQILVRDNNRLIAVAVLRNPRLTDEEVFSFAAQKSLSEDILRAIAASKSWMSQRPIVANLVRNPKTPQAIALHHVGRLSNRELMAIGRDRNVPEVTRRMAQHHLQIRQPTARSFRKH